VGERVLAMKLFLACLAGLTLLPNALASPTMIPLVGILAQRSNPCPGVSTPGALCPGGSIYLGTLSPGATSGSGTDKYMITPGGCPDIPGGSVSGGSGGTSYANADFAVTCSGSDATTKAWNDGSGNYYDIPGLTNWQYAGGTGNAATSTDDKYGADNQAVITAITGAGQGGYHAAARYCDKLVTAGFDDWYLPNMYELNLVYTNRAAIAGLNTAGTYYWSSTEYSASGTWLQRMTDGNQGLFNKNNAVLVRCIRRYK